MAKENDKVDDIEVPDEEDLEGLDDSTDWKAKADELQKKHREAGIRNRERTKTLKDKIAELETKTAPPLPPKEDKKSDEFGLLQKTYLRAAGITAEDEVELAKDIQKRTGLDWDKLVDDEYFQAKIEKLRTTKANTEATSNIKGGMGVSQAKNTPEYWIAKGTSPTPDVMPDRKTRAKIIRAMMAKQESGGKFYNE